jgi:hypothetical protein
VDTAVAPRRVLPSEADDEPASLDCGGSPAGPVRTGPVVCDETSMPAQDGVRFDQEGRPAVAAEHASERGDDRTVAGLETDRGT